MDRSLVELLGRAEERQSDKEKGWANHREMQLLMEEGAHVTMMRQRDSYVEAMFRGFTFVHVCNSRQCSFETLFSS